MKKTCTLWVLGFLLLIPIKSFTQSALEIGLSYMEAHRAEWQLSREDVDQYTISDHYKSDHNGITHIYLQQTHQRIPVVNAQISIHVDESGKVWRVNNDFISSLSSKTNSHTASVTPIQAVTNVALEKGWAITTPLVELESPEGVLQATQLNDGGISRDPIPAKLTYLTISDSEVRLVWEVVVYELLEENQWILWIDAQDGQLIDEFNQVIHCEFGGTENHVESPATEDVPSPFHAPAFRPMIMTPTYRAYNMPIESPNHGSRSLLVDPSDSLASPFGWHDTDGTVGAEYTITRGNNVNAYEDGGNNNAPGYSPDGGTALLFDYALAVGTNPNSYEDAAITNLFVWNNFLHDVLYHYGFDENSGNFQENNYGRGGQDGDYVRAEAQDGSGTNNANFATPSDGSRPRMQMYVWNVNGGPLRDSDIDNGIIAHEYGHGVSNRLTGGPDASNCLRNAEQAGEGWSDFFALIMTVEPGDQGTDVRGIGTYAWGEPITGVGIRDFPYSTDMSINPMTYDNIKNLSVPHGVGSVMCTMLWDMYWRFVEDYGYDDDIYEGVGGNNMAVQLVMDGMKFQPCNPGFVDVRDAIIFADSVNYGGVNTCMIWEVFARRGLGASADQGSSGSRGDGVQAFDEPPICNPQIITTKKVDKREVLLGDTLTYTLQFQNLTGGPITNVVGTDTLPDEINYVAGSLDCGGLESAGVINIPIGNMMANEIFVCTFQATVDTSTQGTYFAFSDDLEGSVDIYSIQSDVSTYAWELDTGKAYSGDHAWYLINLSILSDQSLIFAPDSLAPADSIMSFWHMYETEAKGDGGFVEIFVPDSGGWVDLGPHMMQNGYTETLQPNNPAGQRLAFSGSSNGYIRTRINIGQFISDSMSIRFRGVCNTSTRVDGWYIDDIRFGPADEKTIQNIACATSTEGFEDCDSIRTPTLILSLDTQVEDTTTTAIDPLKNAFSFSVYPNPAEDRVTVEIDDIRKHPATIRLVNMYGQVLNQKELLPAERKMIFDLKELSAGVYFIQIEAPNGLGIKKLIVE